MHTTPQGYVVERAEDGAIQRIGRRRDGRLDGPVWMARGAPEFPACAEVVTAAIVAYSRGLCQGVRFFDRDEVETTRAGFALSDHDLDPLLDAGAVDSFVADGRARRFFDGLAREDAFLGPVPRTWGFPSPGDDRALFGRPPPAWLQAWRETLAAHPQRSLVGLHPLGGISNDLNDPFGARSVLESALDGALVGQLLLDGVGTTPDEVADLIALRRSGAVLAISTKEPWRPLGWASLGAVVYAAAALTGFEARRVSLQALRRAALALADQVGIEACLPFLAENPEAIPGRTLLLRGASPLSPEEEARVAWLRHLGWASDEDAPRLPPLPPRQPIPSPPETSGDVLFGLARGYLVSDDEGLAEALQQARRSDAGLLHRAAARIQVHVRGGAAPYGDAARLGGLRDPRGARAALTAQWRQGQAPSPVVGQPFATPDAVCDRAWALLDDAARLQQLRREALPRFPALDALLAEIEALPMFSLTAEHALKLREADARALLPFLLALAQDGEYAAAQALCRDELGPWVRAEPRLRPLARAMARDPNMGAQRYRWLTLVGDPDDVAWLCEQARGLAAERVRRREVIGFAWWEVLSALASLDPGAAATLLGEALALPELFPAERLELAQLLVLLGDARALPALLAAEPPLDWSGMVWPYAAAMLRAAPLLSAEERLSLLANLETVQSHRGPELARRLIRAALGAEEGEIEAELAALITASDGMIADAVQALGAAGVLPEGAREAALRHAEASVRRVAMDLPTGAPAEDQRSSQASVYRSG